jgi:uncharacterized protein (TIGR03545 family)
MTNEENKDIQTAEEEKDDKKKKEKKPKKKGPIRTAAVVPFFTIVILVFAYFHFFFDSNLESAIEVGGYYATGAEVNVGDIDTSFWNASFQLTGLEFTDPEKPTHNSVEVGAIRFRLLWDGLLRAKFVINEATVKDISVSTPRKRPGKVKKAEDTSGSPNKTRTEAVAAAKEEFDGNALGDIAGLLGGADPGKEIGNIEGELESKKRIDELSKELSTKQKEWENQIASLPKPAEFQALQNRASAVKIQGNPAQIKKAIDELNAIKKEAETKYNTVQTTTNTVTSDINRINKEIKGIDKLVKKDQERLAKRMKLPSLNSKDIAKMLFGRIFHGKVAKFERYYSLYEKYAPPKKSKEEKLAQKPQPPPRGEGKNYQFGRPKAYPMFWMKKAEINSETEDGTLRGKILHLTSDQATIGKPTEITLQGDFPPKKIRDFDFKATLDHREKPGKDVVVAKVGSYPVDQQMLSDSEDVKFGFNKASGELDLKGYQKGDQVAIKSINKFKNIDYKVAAKNSTVNDVLKGVARDTPVVTVNASAKGKWESLGWDVQSNLGGAIQKSFNKQLKEKIDAAKAKVKAQIDKQIGGARKKLTDQFAGVKNQVTGQLGQSKKAADGAINGSKNQITKAKNHHKNQAKKKADKAKKKAVKDLKKKFGF